MFTAIVQVAPAAIVPPESATEPAPAVAATVPLQVVVAFGAAAMVKPAGNVSVSATAVKFTAAGSAFAIESVSTETPPDAISDGVNDFVNVTLADAVTTSDAFAGPVFVAPWAVVTAAAGIVFAYVPTNAELTATVKLQVTLAPIAAPASATVVPAAIAATAPPQDVVVAGVVAIFRPEGKASLRARPVRLTALAAVFATVIVSVEATFWMTDVGEKLLLIVTGGAICSDAVAGVALVAPCAVVTPFAGIVLT
jgi:hypothetical protein